jgi:hypothetical protein
MMMKTLNHSVHGEHSECKNLVGFCFFAVPRDWLRGMFAVLAVVKKSSPA